MLLKLFLRGQCKHAFLAVIKLMSCVHLRVFFVPNLLFNMIFDSFDLAELGITILSRTLEILRRRLTSPWLMHFLHTTHTPCQVLRINSVNLIV